MAARPAVTDRNPTRDGIAFTASPSPSFPAAYSISEFCESHRISESFYFKLKKQGRGPREMRVGDRVLISLEAAADWRRERESLEAAADWRKARETAA
jgi:hypothetical protein